MANDQNPPLSLPASADLSASQFCAVNLNAAGQLILPAAGGKAIGILYTKPNALGRVGTVETLHGKKLRAKYGGPVTAGDPLKLDAAGRFVLAAGADLTTVGVTHARAVKTGVLNDIGEIIWMPSC